MKATKALWNTVSDLLRYAEGDLRYSVSGAASRVTLYTAMLVACTDSLGGPPGHVPFSQSSLFSS